MSNFIIETRHVGISVTNLEKSLIFYKDILGFKIQRIMNESGKFIDEILSNSDVNVKTVKLSINDGITLIELLEFKNPKPSICNTDIQNIGASHVAFTVSKIDKFYKELVSKGIKFKSEPQISPDGYAKVAFCEDPDGMSVELVEVLNPNILNSSKTN
jgi:catechol 2,3-dioxygenase-like lactoylglutathione lyase family enzyme